MTTTQFPQPINTAEQTEVLRAFITLMNRESASAEAQDALGVISEAAREGTMLEAVKAIAEA